MKKFLGLLFFFLFLMNFNNTHAQINNVLNKLSNAKSNKIKDERKIVDSTKMSWYRIVDSLRSEFYETPSDWDTIPSMDEVDNPPQYTGGDIALIKYIEKNKPKSTDSINYEGLTIVKFMVTEDAFARFPKIVYSTCKACDKYVVDLIEDMPRWDKAPKHYDLKVNMNYYLPITFPLLNKK